MIYNCKGIQLHRVFKWYKLQKFLSGIQLQKKIQWILIEGVIQFLVHFLLFDCNHIWNTFQTSLHSDSIWDWIVGQKVTSINFILETYYVNTFDLLSQYIQFATNYAIWKSVPLSESLVISISFNLIIKATSFIIWDF